MVLDKVKARIEGWIQARPWLDHMVRAGGRYQRQRGDYYAAGITYFTVLSLFPLLMVGFAVAGFVLANNPELLTQIQEKIVENIPGSAGEQLNDLIDQAVESRAGVGIIGLAAGLYSGLGWAANLRAALTEQWEQKAEERNWFVTKGSDLLALIGLGLASVVSLGLSVLAGSGLAGELLETVGLDHVPGATAVLTGLSLLLAVLATWALFVWIIARMPRHAVTLRSAARAALMAAIAFEIFKQLATFVLKRVATSPAGVAFGPILGLMVFSYITARIILFATAWAATASENDVPADIPAPGPAVIEPRVTGPGLTAGAGAALFGAGALAAGLLSTLRRRR
ncbi:inner membrane protein YhjD [Nocardia otitidiscaviarum]|uniref:Inner membrane protein YhjD n=1 Tax=Nocardia otitidiscaviarum TaxID=1823 RepID=A0A516NRX9_9NOCA|nr:inner membrane protein YhjD [Nocardia otitidiscaviarum]MCP9620854.1 inner membrane protein YhjD [Nocardia otitidiscaviarum]QDP81641.1 inner membrane protein YhjD [Nocardia otitidiscaviarum]